MLRVLSDFAVDVDQTHLALTEFLAGGPDFELPKLPQLWVPRPSHTLRRADTGLPTVNRFGSMDSNEPLEPILSAASYPPLRKTQGRGTRLVDVGMHLFVGLGKAEATVLVFHVT